MKKLVAISSMALFLFAGQYDITGIRQSNLNAGSENLPKIEYHQAAPLPGQVTKIKKSFNSAPPMIPHKVDHMLPIKIGHNECLACHMPNTAKALGIHGMPKDHFINTFDRTSSGKYVAVHQKHRIAGSRYNCTQCHAPQAKLDPVVQNKFESLRNR
jgi:cytochrome c-type protein NapB